MATNPKVVVKKIQAYPIECVLRMDQQFHKGSVQRLVEKGVMVEIGELHLKLRTILDIRLKIPATESHIDSKVEVIKVYDRFDPTSRGVNHLVEMHFRELPESQKKAIREFIQRLNSNKV